MSASLLFDLDGTLVDTDKAHFSAFGEAFAPYDVAIDWEIYRTRIMGAANSAITREFLGHVPESEHEAIMDRKEALYRAGVGEIEPVAGLAALLDLADEAGIPCAVVTNAPRPNADLVLNALKIAGRFKALVIGGELSHTKPHPLPYLEGLRALGASAARSIAFEDSRSGIASAHAAGVTVVAMTTSLDARTGLSLGASLAARDFTDLAVIALVRSTALQDPISATSAPRWRQRPAR
jgi:HAD superfamily hydrolase (TIGR01509 family)